MRMMEECLGACDRIRVVTDSLMRVMAVAKRYQIGVYIRRADVRHLPSLFEGSSTQNEKNRYLEHGHAYFERIH